MIKTSLKHEFVDITSQVTEAVKQSEKSDGLVCVFVPHTTAGITINENADPDVVRDIMLTLSELVPVRPDYRHFEGNSDAHVKASVLGSSITVILENGKLKMGTWQSIYFTEFDGPRRREVWVHVI